MEEGSCESRLVCTSANTEVLKVTTQVIIRQVAEAFGTKDSCYGPLNSPQVFPLRDGLLRLLHGLLRHGGGGGARPRPPRTLRWFPPREGVGPAATAKARVPISQARRTSKGALSRGPGSLGARIEVLASVEKHLTSLSASAAVSLSSPSLALAIFVCCREILPECRAAQIGNKYMPRGAKAS